jgi:hypothetical protein
VKKRRLITRKSVLRLTSSLILGVVLSIVIAVSCTLWSRTETWYDGPLLLERDVRWWQDHIDEVFPVEPSGCYHRLGFGKASVLLYIEDSNTSMVNSRTGAITYAGWPCYCLRGGTIVDRFRGQMWNHHMVYRVDWIPWTQQVWLPTEILWPGLLCDAAVYGAAILLFWSGAGMARRRMRLRRGRCPNGAYVLGSASLRCSECGWHRTQQRVSN